VFFRIRDYLPDFKRLPADWLLAAVLSIISSAIGTWQAAIAENAPDITSVGWLIVFVALAFAILALMAFGAWLVGWAKRQWRREAPKEGLQERQLAAPNAGKKTEYVQFGLPTNWQVGPGFKLVTLPSVDGRERDQAEEVRVFMRVEKKMQNAELEIRASRRRADGWETIAKITSPSLAGTIHKGKRESLPLMRRTFRMVSAQYDDPFLGTKQRINVRADKEVVIFPDDPAAFPAKLGEEYEFRIRIYHDEGPEQATVTVNLHQRLEVPQTRITSRENIEPIISGQLA
jgi:hypothetical protein